MGRQHIGASKEERLAGEGAASQAQQRTHEDSSGVPSPMPGSTTTGAAEGLMVRVLMMSRFSEGAAVLALALAVGAREGPLLAMSDRPGSPASRRPARERCAYGLVLSAASLPLPLPRA